MKRYDHFQILAQVFAGVHARLSSFCMCPLLQKGSCRTLVDASRNHSCSYQPTATTGLTMASGNDNTSSNSDLRVVGSHRPGSIQRVQLKNFLTHGNVEFRPGARFVVVKNQDYSFC
jgi:hypothetical protein